MNYRALVFRNKEVTVKVPSLFLIVKAACVAEDRQETSTTRAHDNPIQIMLLVEYFKQSKRRFYF